MKFTIAAEAAISRFSRRYSKSPIERTVVSRCFTASPCKEVNRPSDTTMQLEASESGWKSGRRD